MNLSGSPIDYFVVFFGGVLFSFTPCVYSLIPISAGFISVSAGGSRFKGLVLSLIYVTGIAVTYSALGLLASLTGNIFGVITTHPLTHLLAGIVIIFFGLSMWDMFSIALPNIFNAHPCLKKRNYFSTFILGLSSGLIVGPCLTPVLGAILTILATRKNVNIIYGTTLLFTFAYGMGLILITVGTFSSILVSLPKTRRWMACIKKVAALILIGTGIYFIITGVRRL